jgi:hypothetical protein
MIIRSGCVSLQIIEIPKKSCSLVISYPNRLPSKWRLTMIEALEGFPANVVAFACHGHVTKQDYDSVLLPVVAKALEENEKLRLYYETAPDFAGIEAGAVWEDTKVGMTHLLRWERLAVVTDVDWIRHTMRLFAFLVPGEMKVFPPDEAAQAREWIVS